VTPLRTVKRERGDTSTFVALSEFSRKGVFHGKEGKEEKVPLTCKCNRSHGGQTAVCA